VPRRAPTILALVVAAWTLAPSALASSPHDDLCDLLLTERPDPVALGAVLMAGASANDACSVPYTSRRIHAAGAILSVVTGGLWLLSPILDKDLLTERVVRTRSVPPLRLAADLRDEATMTLLLQHGARVDTLDGAFADAVSQDDLVWAERLAALGAERSLAVLPAALLHRPRLERVLAMDPTLDVASIHWDADVVRQMSADPVMLDLLLDAGLDPAQLHGAFQAAVMADSLPLARRLVERGAARTLGELDPARLGDERSLQEVLVFEPDVSGLDLHWVDVRGALETNPRVLMQLVSVGFVLSELAFDAVEAHRWDDLDLLLSLGFALDAEYDGRFHRRLLNQAVADGDLVAVSALLDRGARLLEGVFDHPVERALDDGNMAMVELLLDRMGDRAVAQDWWHRVLRTAIYDDSSSLAASCLQDGRLGGTVLERPVVQALSHDNPAILELLLAHSGDPQGDLEAGLRAAAAMADPAAVSLTLELGASATALGDDGASAIHGAAGTTAGEPAAVMALLVEQGASVDGVTDQRAAPLHLAVESGLASSVHALIGMGADVEIQDADGRTPLALAVGLRQWEALELLTQQGAQVEGWMVTELCSRYPFAPPETVLALAAGQHDLSPRFWRAQARRVQRRNPELAESLRAEAKNRR